MRESSGAPVRRALLLNTTPVIGGTARLVQCLARELTAKGAQVRTAFPADPRGVDTVAWFRREGLATEPSDALLPMEAPHGWRQMAALSRFVRASGADVVSLHYGLSYISLKDVLAIRMAGRCRLVVSLHYPTPWRDLGPRKRRMTGVAARLCNAVVATNSAVEAVAREAGVPGGRLHTVPCGVNIPRRLPARAPARKRLEIPDGAFVIGTLSRLEPEKGVGDLIEAAARLRPGGEIVLAIGGYGGERAALEQLAAERLAGRARFLGLVMDAADLYAASDVVALPARSQGLGLVFTEAAFHAVPGIAARVGGMDHTVIHGETGILVPPRDPAALAAALEVLRYDPGLRRALGEGARVRAYARCTEQAMADAYATLFAA